MSASVKAEQARAREAVGAVPVGYDNLTVDNALERALGLLRRPEKSALFFLNLDSLNKAMKDPEYRRILGAASLVLPDGIGLRVASALSGRKMKANCNGTDFSPLLIAECARRGVKIFLLGGLPAVAWQAARNLRDRFPDLRIAGTHSGYFTDDAAVVRRINESGAQVLFVSMGSPIQEKWIMRHRRALDPRLCLGVGALLDWLSGHRKRSPLILRKLSLEWLWRILIEPKRMSKRYLVEGLGCLALLALWRLRANAGKRGILKEAAP